MNSVPEAKDGALEKFLPVADLRSAVKQPAASRWFQFSLRAIFALMTTVAFLCWIVPQIPDEVIFGAVIMFYAIIGVLCLISIIHLE